jgi:hypothetical protein
MTAAGLPDRQPEPVFVLRAQDQFAPQVIEYWASLVAGAVANTVSSKADATKQKVVRARALAHTLRAWQTLFGAKIPD